MAQLLLYRMAIARNIYLPFIYSSAAHALYNEDVVREIFKEKAEGLQYERITTSLDVPSEWLSGSTFFQSWQSEHNYHWMFLAELIQKSPLRSKRGLPQVESRDASDYNAKIAVQSVYN